MKTLAELRNDCKKCGIKVSKKTLSWGPHLSFSIDGIEASSVLTRAFCEVHKEAFDALKTIREQYKGMTIDGQKVYGI